MRQDLPNQDRLAEAIQNLANAISTSGGGGGGEEVADVAERLGRTPAQVLLRWATQRGHCVIPKSTDADHMRMNLEAVSDGGGGFRLSDEDMEAIGSLDQSRVDAPSSDGTGISGSRPNEKARLCWVRDPLKMLDFD